MVSHSAGRQVQELIKVIRLGATASPTLLTIMEDRIGRMIMALFISLSHVTGSYSFKHPLLMHLHFPFLAMNGFFSLKLNNLLLSLLSLLLGDLSIGVRNENSNSPLVDLYKEILGFLAFSRFGLELLPWTSVRTRRGIFLWFRGILGVLLTFLGSRWWPLTFLVLSIDLGIGWFWLSL